MGPNELMHITMYILKGYIGIFALTTMLFESKQEWIGSLGALRTYQEWLIKHCEFLSLMGGRGAFYMFQGTLWLTFADSLSEILEITVACALIFIGILHVAAHHGFMPHDILQKVLGKKADGLGEYDMSHAGGHNFMANDP